MITFRLTPDEGEPFEVTAGSRDVLVWERTGRGRSFSKLEDEQKMSDFYSLAHSAAKRQGAYSGKLEDFELEHELLPISEEEPDPTPPDHSPDE